jgi:hypothetical protein
VRQEPEAALTQPEVRIVVVHRGIHKDARDLVDEIEPGMEIIMRPANLAARGLTGRFPIAPKGRQVLSIATNARRAPRLRGLVVTACQNPRISR